MIIVTQKKTKPRQTQGFPLSTLSAMKRRMEPREMTPAEEAKLWPEVVSLTNAAIASSRLTPAELEQYRGDFVAWSPDGKHIIAQAKEREDLIQKLDTLGVNTLNCVIQFIDDAEDRI